MFCTQYNYKYTSMCACVYVCVAMKASQFHSILIIKAMIISVYIVLMQTHSHYYYY